ncbi:hypothetical protein RMATCC62417_13291 [Rhizopus microsporus]|nr:hypothetical protein RMATCC62417_13291 [Rhizopus microsporus]
MHPAIRHFFKRSFSHPEVVPLMVIVGSALTAATYSGYRQLHSPGLRTNFHQTSLPNWNPVNDRDRVRFHHIH